MCFKFLFKTGGVCDHLKFTWQTVPLCWTAERKSTFIEFCKKSKFQVAAAASLVLGDRQEAARGIAWKWGIF